MFEHFTFGAPAQTSYIQPEDSFPSPTDCSFRLETPPPTSSYDGEGSRGGINDIVNKLSEQSLQLDDEQPQRSIWMNGPLTPDFDDETMDFTEEELTYNSTNHGRVALPTHTHSPPNISSINAPKNGTVACRRLQRQLNVQLQSCNSHIRDITALVEEMISTSSQCRLHKSTSRPNIHHHYTLPTSFHDTITPFPTIPLELDADDEDSIPQPELHEDEGFAEMEDDENEISLRRASAPIGIRKDYGVRWRANGECVGGPPELAWVGRKKVRCVPRMRRRKERSEMGLGVVGE